MTEDQIKALYVKANGSDAGWDSIPGLHFHRGITAALTQLTESQQWAAGYKHGLWQAKNCALPPAASGEPADFDTPGNRHPEHRYAGYKGEPLKAWATDDQRKAWEEGQAARVRPRCKGMNCGATDGRSHSLECEAEHAAAIAGGKFVKDAAAPQPAPAPMPTTEEVATYWRRQWESATDRVNEQAKTIQRLTTAAQPAPEPAANGGPAGLLACEIQPRPLAYPLADYHRAGSEGPLHYTWTDKPHRLLYDLIAAVRYYAAPQPTIPQPTIAQPLGPHNIKLDGRYNWKGQSDRLIYIGRINGWYQFKKIGDPRPVWCEVLPRDLHQLEETKDETT